MIPLSYADCDTCWGLGLVYRLPPRRVWVPPERLAKAVLWPQGRWAETCFVRCESCNAEAK